MSTFIKSWAIKPNKGSLNIMPLDIDTIKKEESGTYDSVMMRLDNLDPWVSDSEMCCNVICTQFGFEMGEAFDFVMHWMVENKTYFRGELNHVR